MNLMRCVESWTTTLKEVHKDIVENVEYIEGVVGKENFMVALRNLQA